MLVMNLHHKIVKVQNGAYLSTDLNTLIPVNNVNLTVHLCHYIILLLYEDRESGY